MGVLIKPNLDIGSIKIEKDEDDQYGTDRILGEWGRNIPLIKIGDYVLGIGDLEDFELRVALNCLPTFSMTVNDEQYLIRESLKNDVDKCIIFIGYETWYIKFNGIIDKSFSEVGDVSIMLSGQFYNEKLYNTNQFVYSEISVSDVFTDICKQTSMGLFVDDNEDLNKEIFHSINPNICYLDYFERLLKQYTLNTYSIDCFGYIHVVDINKLREQPIDKYTLDWRTGEQISETDIIFKSLIKNGSADKDDEENDKISIDYYSIDTNFSDIFRKSQSVYNIGNSIDGIQKLKSNEIVGIGEKNTNTFPGFVKYKFPFYYERINKKLGGNLIKITTENIIFELSPFSIVGFECYLPFIAGRDVKLDEEHSGKKIVISNTLNYQKSNNSDTAKLVQSIEMI